MNSVKPGSQASINPALSPLSIARILWKRKFLILTCWIVLCAVTLTIVHRLPAIYMADTLILVDSQKIPEKYVTSTVSTELQDRLMTINQQILSSTRLQKIIDDFGLYSQEKKTAFPEEILERMRNDISLNIEASGSGNRPGAFRIGYQGTNPSLVAQVANRIANLYIEENLKTRETQAEGTSEFIENQLKDAKKTLDDLEAKVSKYKLAHNGDLPQQEGALTAALSHLQTELQGNQDAISRAQQNKLMLQGTVDMAEAAGASANAQHRSDGLTVASNSPAHQKESEFLQAQYDALGKTYLPSYPKMVALQHRIDQLRADEDREGARIENLKKEIALADADIKQRSAERDRILKSIEQYQARIEQLPVREQEMAELTRDYETSKTNYKSLLDKKLSAEMASDMEHRQKSERFTVLDPARVPEKPIKPKRGILDLMGCAIGLGFGLLLGFGLEFKQNVFLGEWELPAQTTILCRIPYIHVVGESSSGHSFLSWRRNLIVCMLLLGPVAAAVYYLISRGS